MATSGAPAPTDLVSVGQGIGYYAGIASPPIPLSTSRGEGARG